MTTTDFRPETLDDIVGQVEIVKFLKAACARPVSEFPHLNLHGPAGSGKTTAALAIAKTLLGDALRDNLLTMNASDERGINDVRSQIIPFLGRMPSDGIRRKIVFLDEADKLTPDAQTALRAPIEEYENENIFIFACNDARRLIAPLRDSRLLTLGFRRLKDEEIRELLVRLAQRENRSQETIDAAVRHAKGDARRAVGIFLSEFGEGDKYQRLDAEIKRVFDKTLGTKDDRIHQFLVFLRDEGFTGWEEVFEAIADLGHDGQLGLGDRRWAFVSNAVQYAYRCGQVQNPLFQVRGFLVAEVP